MDRGLCQVLDQGVIKIILQNVGHQGQKECIWFQFRKQLSRWWVLYPSMQLIPGSPVQVQSNYKAQER